MLPPRSFAAPPSLNDETLTCRVSFDQRNGAPTQAILMPVVLRDGQWKILQEGRPVDLIDIRRIGAAAVAAEASSDGQTVTTKLAWPSDADRAVLLLIHPQMTTRSDDDYDEVADHTEPVSLENGVVTRSEAPANDANRPAAFAVSSCQYPAGILDGSVRIRRRALDDRYVGPAERSLWRLGERLENDPSIRFTVLTGDQVYVDRTAGLFDPSKLLERLAFAYDAFMLNAGLQRVLRVADTDIFPMLDDHEVSDNWEPRPRGFGRDEIQGEMGQGRHEYLERQRTMWPEAILKELDKEREREKQEREEQEREERESEERESEERESEERANYRQLWAKTAVYGYQFFFADARTQRTGRTIDNLKVATILGPKQSENLCAWIRSNGSTDRPSFVVSSSILLPRYLSMQKCSVTSDCPAMALQTDSWAGYPKSLHDLLAWVYDANAQRLVFLSGDEHLSCLATITIECDDLARKVTVHSIHSSALYAPYTFANSTVKDFASPDCFAFDHGSGTSRRRFRCRVETFFPESGDGFTIVRPYRTDDSGWRLDVEFNGADAKVRQTIKLS